MNPTPPPAPVDVVVHSGPAEWWQVVAALGPLAVLLTGLVAALISILVLRQRTQADALELIQKTHADSRAEWWRRTQWALDRALDADENTKALGLAALAVLAQSELASTEELELLDIAWRTVNGEGSDADADADADFDRAVDAADGSDENEKRGRQRQRVGQAMGTDTPERKEAAASSPTSGRPATGSKHRVQVGAAKLRVVLDERLGRSTPAKTKELAKEEF